MVKHRKAGYVPACSWGSLGVKGVTEAARVQGHLAQTSLVAAHLAARVVSTVLSGPAALTAVS